MKQVIRQLMFFTAVMWMGFSTLVFGQNADSYETENTTSNKLFDPSKFSIHHIASFSMSSSNNSSLKSQSLYTTLMQYQISKPITLSFNFSLPIHSTYSSAFNLTANNLQSAQYFKSIPFDVSLSWQPKENFMMRFSIIQNNYSQYYHTRQYEPSFFNTAFPPLNELQ